MTHEEVLWVGHVEEVELGVDWDGGLLPRVVGGGALLHYQLLREGNVMTSNLFNIVMSCLIGLQSLGNFTTSNLFDIVMSCLTESGTWLGFYSSFM